MLPLGCHKWLADPHLRFLCAVGHAVTFAVDAALVVYGHTCCFSSLRYDPTGIETLLPPSVARPL